MNGKIRKPIGKLRGFVENKKTNKPPYSTSNQPVILIYFLLAAIKLILHAWTQKSTKTMLIASYTRYMEAGR